MLACLFNGGFSWRTRNGALCAFASNTQQLEKPAATKRNELSFTVSYLVNSCGLSLESAKSLSKKINFETPERPDAMLNLLRNYGFTDSQISKIVKYQPLMLLANAERTILPKLAFFDSVGISSADLFTSNPPLLKSSLEEYLIPCYKLFKSVLNNNGKVAKALERMKRCPPINNFVVNIKLLRKVGLSQSAIAHLVYVSPTTTFRPPSEFEAAVEKVKELGLEPSKLVFAKAIRVLIGVSESNWKSKFEVFGRWGWSDDDTLLAFRKEPICMTLSEKKIMQVMEFLVNRMGWQSKQVAKSPYVLFSSFEKNIVPRYTVIRALQVKGLTKKSMSLGSITCRSEEYFLKHFVFKYADVVPQLPSLYKGELGLSDLGIEEHVK